MNMDRMHRNYNEENDLTSAKKRAYINSHVLIAEFVKIIDHTTGIFTLFKSKDASRLDSRDTRKIKYSIQVILIVALLSNCLGISMINNLQAASIFQHSVDNVNYLAGQDLDEIPNYETLNNALAGITDISWFEEVAQDVFEKLHRSGRFGRKRKGGNRKLKWEMPGIRVIMDATDYAFFRSPHCLHDLTATFHKGTKEEKTYYYHKALVAKAVLAPHLLVPIAIEFIENDDVTTTSKQDCENAAALRALARIKNRFPKMHFVICGDALYANKTFISKCKEYKWDYLFTLRKGVQPTLCEEYEYQKKHWGLQSARVQYGDHETGTLFWSDDLGSIVESSLPIYILEYITSVTLQKGKSVRKAGSVPLRRKDFTMDMPELSKDRGRFDLDEKALSKRKRSKAQKRALKEEKSSEKIKEAVAKVNPDQAADINEACVHVSRGEPKAGDTIDVTFMYITSIPITEENVCTLLVLGRDRWSIEEAFRNAKLGTMQIEHLRTLDSNGMKVYFWLEELADILQEVYIYYSDILKIAGSRKKVCEMLQNSFENQSLEACRDYLSDSTRVCLWARDEEHHRYPKVKIIAESTPQTTKTMGKKKDSQNCKASAQKKQPEKTSGKERDKETAFTEAKSSKDTHAPAEKETDKSPKALADSEEAKCFRPKESISGEEAPCFSDVQKSRGNTAQSEEEKVKTIPTLEKEPAEPEESKTDPFSEENPDKCQGKVSPENSAERTKGHTRHRIRMRLNPNRRRRGTGEDWVGASHEQDEDVGPGDDGTPPFGCPETAKKEVI